MDATIARHLSAGDIPEDAVEYATDLLTWITPGLTPEQLEDATSVQAFNDILKVFPDHENFADTKRSRYADHDNEDRLNEADLVERMSIGWIEDHVRDGKVVN